MASHTPVVIHNENLHIHRGKSGGGLPKPAAAKSGLQERRPLGDLSNAAAIPRASGPAKPSEKSGVKGKSGSSGRGAAKAAPKSGGGAVNDERKCREWAKEGIERAHFTGNDAQKLQKEWEEERVSKEVEMVMSAMREWTEVAVNQGWSRMGRVLGIPEVPEDTEDITNLELVPEELPLTINLRSQSDEEEIFDLLEAEFDPYPFPDSSFELKQKEDYGYSM